MKFSTREDIEAPIDHVFAQVSDFDGFARRALRHGAQVTRVDSDPVAIGATWDMAFKFRGRERKMQAILTQLDPPHQYLLVTASDGLTVDTVVELVALSRGRTRVSVSMDIHAKTLTSRLLLQSIKLAKGRLVKRFKARVLEYAEDIEDAYRKSA